MKARDYFVSNPCSCTPISVPYIPCDHIIRQTHATALGFDIDCFAVHTDMTDYEHIEPDDERTVPCVTVKDNGTLIHILELIEKTPDLPEALLEQLIREYHIGNINLGHGYTYVAISGLREELNNLYLLFICYRILIWNEKLSSIGPLWKERLRRKAEQASVISSNEHELCTGFLTLLIQNDVSCNTVFTMTESGELQRIYECNTVDDALIYQLFLHIEAGEKGRNGYTLAHCKRCGAMYPQETRKYSLCDICRTPSERTRACREKKRKEALNAQENHP